MERGPEVQCERRRWREAGQPCAEYKKALRMRNTTMIRAIYRWRVKSGEEEKFIQAWMQGTAAIRAKVIGAGGSLLMRSRHDRTEFMALACWNSIEDWQAFAADNDSAPPDPEAFRAMGAVCEHISTEILEEVADLLDCVP